MDVQVSLHFRGPLQLKQFAVYLPSNSGQTSKREEVSVAGQAERLPHAHRLLHNHHHQPIHGHAAAPQRKRQNEGVMVTATIDGKVQSWINNWFGKSTSNAGKY
jgi:hypothetical protein